MPYDKQSNVFRYIIPSALLLAIVLMLSPKEVLDNVTSIQDVLILVLAMLILGFAMDVAVLPLVVKIIQGVKRRITRKATVYDCVQIIQSLKESEIKSITDDKARDLIDRKITPISIFDAYVNENENEKTIGRLFFLFDMLHSMSNCAFVCAVTLILPLILYLLDVSMDFTPLWVYYPVVGGLFVAFARSRQSYYDKANAFMCTLMTKDLGRLRGFIQKTVAGAIIAYFKPNGEEYFGLHTWGNYKGIVVALNDCLDRKKKMS